MAVDMSQNRVPYGLLTDEEKAALETHESAGGEFLYTSIIQSWYGTNKPEWALNTIYRTVPLPLTTDEIAWDRLPDWVEHVARDADNEVTAFEGDPGTTDFVWTAHFGKRRRIDDFPGIVIKRGTCDWKDSKQRRPK